MRGRLAPSNGRSIKVYMPSKIFTILSNMGRRPEMLDMSLPFVNTPFVNTYTSVATERWEKWKVSLIAGITNSITMRTNPIEEDTQEAEERETEPGRNRGIPSFGPRKDIGPETIGSGVVGYFKAFHMEARMTKYPGYNPGPKEAEDCAAID
ncbi:hypothetical protein DUI87_24962 [Hirundo rustica rustica]|uniref:Uncharacterized protein n=1 Tax=Hirundo rustica rustica TaxID=333673 RepID=A0A3M0JIA4_HIRRU|nr:hypothetical protein DUI87_24962 [Hirundo rustica rustica]